ncbi:MAG TPA: hypothetical protein VGL81_07495 [Polyangiaceae bacterium]
MLLRRNAAAPAFVAFAALAMLSTLTACSPSSAGSGDGGNTEPCPVGFLGSDAAAPDFDMQVLLADETVAALNDGDTVPMILPPQGGRVIFVGVRATNVDGCGLQLTGALRDLSTQQVRVDSRTVNLIDTGDGYGVSGTPSTAASAAVSDFSNIPVCPNEWSSTNIYGTVYGVEVTIQDREGRTLTKKIQVTPECGQPENLEECLCICKGGYILGESCMDGGDE